jgi:serine protease
VTPVPVLAVNPSALNFGLSLDTLTVKVTNSGVGSLEVDYSEDSGGWLGITPPVDPAGLGDYTVTVNRAGLADGVYSAVITFSSTTAGSVQMPVILQIDSDLSPSDVGQLYLLLIDPVSFNTVQSVLAERQDVGTYRFQLSDVPAGVYEIFAGGDFDNDGFLCASGEVCGAYLTLDEPVDIEVNGDRSDLDFGAALSAGLQDAQSAGASAGSGAKGLRRSQDARQIAPR